MAHVVDMEVQESKANKMRRSEYEQELEDIKNRLKKLEQVEIEEDNVWKPEIKENYYMVSGNGTVNKTMWLDYDGEEFRFDFGNVFKTKEEAEYEAERLKVYRQLRRFALNNGRHKGSFCISCLLYTSPSPRDS